MMETGVAKGKRSASIGVEAVEKYAGKPKTQKTEEAEAQSIGEKFADIENNPFYKIVIQSEAGPTEKKEAIAKALVFNEEESKEENEVRIAAFETFKEYLAAYHKEMSKEIIRLADTKAFSELQSVFKDMNAALLQFEVRITPLVEIIDAVHRLNMASNSAMYDVFNEIQEDKEEEARIQKQRTEQLAQLERLEAEIMQSQRDIAALREEKSWFGLGGTKQRALQEIARKEVDIENRRQEITRLRETIDNTLNSR